MTDAVPDIFDLIDYQIPPEPEAPEDERDLLSQPADHAGHADVVLQLHENKFLYCDAYKWMVWNGKFWQSQDAEAKVCKAIEETLRKRAHAAIDADRQKLAVASVATDKNIRGTLSVLRYKLTVNISDFDNDPDALNVKNGVLNLRTGKLTPHNPHQRYTYCCPVDYDAKADQKQWVEFLKGATESWEYLQTVVGYFLTGRTREEKLFYCYGPRRGGKGTFTETLMAMMGRRLSKETVFDMFTATRKGDDQRFDLADLVACRLVVASESDKHEQLNGAIVKNITGGSSIRCAPKHGSFFEYDPAFKILLTSNNEANGDPEDMALWGRLHIINFPNSHFGKEDTALKERMKSPENLRGVLAWAVQGAINWYKNGLGVPEIVLTETERQRSALDYVPQFIAECTHKLPESRITSAAVHSAYVTWCGELGIKPKGQTAFSRSMGLNGYPAHHGYMPEIKKVTRYFENIAIGNQEKLINLTV